MSASASGGRPALAGDGEVHVSEGTVRGLRIAEAVSSVEYASVRLAGDPTTYKDFDDPDFWQDKKGQRVRIEWCWSEAHDGTMYRVVLDAEAGG